MLFVLAIYILKILCVFLFVVYCVVTFLMVMYNARLEELKDCITAKDEILESDYPLKFYVDEKLGIITKKITEKEQLLQRSHYEIKNAEKILTDLENKTSNYRDGYKLLMSELKKDVRKIEDEVKTLQNHISSLSFRREVLRNEVMKQQEDYQKMLNNFTRELENKKSLFCRFICIDKTYLFFCKTFPFMFDLLGMIF
ncbi:uncharacterized protein LOC117226295 isoform X2 [Megalopta genalis]|uniref:uncharacterized protein LOC117226295 isoform X2 n=1 Tax=Megalopta genalis TaxID=115081 RepID=UPI003FCEFE1C